MKFFQSKFFKIVTISLVVLVALFAIVGFFFLPGIVKPKIIDAIASATGKKATIGDLRINPFALSVTVDNVELFDKDNQSMVGARQLYINYQLKSLFDGSFTFAEISIDSPHVYMKAYPDSTTNFTKLMIDTGAKQPEESKPMVLVIEKFDIRKGIIIYEDRTRPTPLITRLDSLSFALNNFTTKPQENGLYSFDAQTGHGERLSWKGTINVVPPRSTGTFRLSGFQGRTLWEFMQDRFDFEITQGELDIDGQYEFSMKDDQSDFQIHNTSVATKQITIIDKNTKAEAMALTTADVKGIEFSYQAHRMSINLITAQSATVFTTRELDGNYGLKKLLMPHPSPEKDSTKWDFLITKIELNDWSGTMSDLSTTPPTPLHFSRTNVTLENFHMDTDEPVNLRVQSTINSSGSVSVSGTFTLLPITANLVLECSGIGLPAFQPYIDKFAHLKIISGDLGLKGLLSYIDRGTEGDKTFQGSVSIQSFRGVDEVLQEDFLRWKNLELQTINYTSTPSSVSIAEISASEPYIRFIIDSSRTTNLNHIMITTGDSAAPRDTTQPAEKRMLTKINTIVIANGSMNFADLSLTPNFATGIYQLSGNINDLSSENLTHADVNLEGKVDRYAPVTIKGQINPLSEQMYTDILMKFQNIELTTFTPYSGKFAGYRIDKGKLSLELQYKLNQNFLKAENKVIVDQLTLGESVDGPDVTSLPVKLAIALLKDSHGVIDLDLPIEGNINDPEFSVFPIIFKVLVNLITKAVTAPFKLIGSLFGGSDEDLSYVQFSPGSYALTPEQSSKVDNLAKALRERPTLQLDIRGIAADTADLKALAVQSLMKQIRGTSVNQQSDNLSVEEQDRLLQFYRSTFKTEPESLLTPSERITMAKTPELKRQSIIEKTKARLVASMPVTGQDLRVLALNRASAIKERLVYENKIEEPRIFLLDPQFGASLVDGMVQLPLNLNAR